MNAEANRQVALKWLACLERGELDAASALLREDARASVPGYQEMSKAQLQDFLHYAYGVFAPGSLQLKPTGVTAEGERIAVEAVSRASLKSGGYENRYHFLFIVRDERIHFVAVYAQRPLADVAAWSGAPAH